jgi:uncharacterized protein
MTVAMIDVAADFHVIHGSHGAHLLVVDGSRLYDIDAELAAEIERLSSRPPPPAPAAATDGTVWSPIQLGFEVEPTPEPAGSARHSSDPADDAAVWSHLLSLGGAYRYVDGRSLTPPPLYSISLNVAQACNMGCGYCYADAGAFGGQARLMTMDVARATVDRLIAESAEGADLVVGYMGGEPFVNRRVLHETTRYAAKAARDAGRRIRFSVTTNGTLLRPEDARLFTEFPFAVTVSVDGTREIHDAQRPMKDGSSSYDRVRAGLATLSEHGRPRHLSARVTVTPKTGELLPVLDHLVGLGFDEVGFAAVLVSADPALAFGEADFPLFLSRMVACGERALDELLAGRRYPFGNFETALQQIHRGTHRPYPCGAGAAYLSANAEGKLFACHRLIDDPRYAMGTVQAGSDHEARTAHLVKSHVDRMEPCRGCWARYLCGGGCYHEVSRRGRPGCDYIRGWLEFCLGAYVQVSNLRPDYFAATAVSSWPPMSSPTTVAD